MHLPTPIHSSAHNWLNQIFHSKAAQSGGVVRRSVHWVDKEIGRDTFQLEVQRRGFHMIECGGQYVVICNSGGLRVIC